MIAAVIELEDVRVNLGSLDDIKHRCLYSWKEKMLQVFVCPKWKVTVFVVLRERR